MIFVGYSHHDAVWLFVEDGGIGLNSSIVRVEWPIASATKDSGFDVIVPIIQPRVHQ